MRTSSTIRTRGTVKRTTRAAAALAAGALALSLTACGGDERKNKRRAEKRIIRDRKSVV